MPRKRPRAQTPPRKSINCQQSAVSQRLLLLCAALSLLVSLCWLLCRFLDVVVSACCCFRPRKLFIILYWVL